MDKTNKEHSFSAALRLVFSSIALNSEFSSGNNRGTQCNTHAHAAVEGKGTVSVSTLQRKNSRSSPSLALAPLSSVLPRSPTTVDTREVLRNIHTPPHLERGQVTVLTGTCRLFSQGTEVAGSHGGFLLYHVVHGWTFTGPRLMWVPKKGLKHCNS